MALSPWAASRPFVLSLVATLAAFAQNVLADGEVDSNFVPPALPVSVWDVVPMADGSLLVAGGFPSSGTVPMNGLVKLTGTGTVDASFASGQEGITGGSVRCVSRQADGKFVLGGDFTKMHGVTRGKVARLNVDGTLDTSFNPGTGANGAVDTLAIQPDGKILVGGDFTQWNGQSRVGLVRLNTDGSLDTSFANLSSLVTFPGGEWVKWVALQPVNTAPHYAILVAGVFHHNANGGLHSGIIRLKPDGTLDTTFEALKGGQMNSGNNTYAVVSSLAPQMDGKVLVGGRFSHFNGQAASGLIRLNANGTNDSDFRDNMDGGLTGGLEGHEILIQPDGRFVVVGLFSKAGGVNRSNVARFNANGTLDTTFTHPSSDASGVIGLALGADGGLFTGGTAPTNPTLTLRRLNSGLAAGFGTVEFASTAETVTEGNDVTLTINRTGASTEAASVNYQAVAVTAIPGADLPLTSGTITWAQGDTAAKTLVIHVPLDSMLEAPESFVVNLAVPMGAVRLGSAASATVTVQDGDVGSSQPTVFFAAPSSSANEGNGNVVTVDASLSITSGSDIQVPFTLSGTATAGTGKDYTFTPVSPLTIPAGSTSASLTFTLQEDTAPEGNETIIITLGVPASGAVLHVASSQHTLTIVDNESKPSFPAPLESRVVPVNSPNAIFNATAAGLPAPKVDWFYKGKVIAGLTNAPGVMMQNPQLSSAGTFAAKATNVHGSATTSAELVVVDTQEKTIVCALGANAVLPVTLAGVGSTFSWKHGTEAVSGSHYLNATTKSLTVKGTVATDFGSYTCKVNGPGPDSLEVAFKLKVVEAKPLFDTALIDLGTKVVSEPVSFNVKAELDLGTNDKFYAASFSASGLPSGLKIDPVTGVISGQPLAVSKPAGFSFTVKATNPKGTSTVPGKLVVNPLPDRLAGAYNLFVDRHDNFNPLGGRINFDVFSNGTLSGKCFLGAATHNFKGALNTSTATPGVATATIDIPRTGASTLVLVFSFDSATGYITTGNLANGVFNTPVSGWRNLWNPAPAVKPYAGYYTMACNPPLPVDAAIPQGNSVATFTVGATGACTIAGTAADGQSLSSACNVGPNGELILFTAASKGLSTMHGKVTITQGTPPDFVDNTISGASINWTRALSTDRVYRSGFTNVQLTAVGGRYIPPAGTALVMNCDDRDNNAELIFAEGGVPTGTPPSPNVNLRIKAKGAVTIQTTPNVRATSLTIYPATGLFKGGFSIDDPNPSNANKVEKRPATFNGVILRHSGGLSGCGWFLLQELSTPPAVTSTQTRKFSGQVRLEKKPAP